MNARYRFRTNPGSSWLVARSFEPAESAPLLPDFRIPLAYAATETSLHMLVLHLKLDGPHFRVILQPVAAKER